MSPIRGRSTLKRFLARTVSSALIVSVLPVLITSTAFEPQRAGAAGTCLSPFGSDSPNHQYTGYQFDEYASVFGSAAYLINGINTNCSGSSLVQTSSWVMVHGCCGSGANYMQSGVLNQYGTPQKFFSEQNLNGSIQDVYGANVGNGQEHLYYEAAIANPLYPVEEPTVPNIEASVVDNTEFQTTGYDPYNPGFWSEPISASYQSETNDPHSDMPGSNVYGWVTYTNAQYQTGSLAFTGNASFPSGYLSGGAAARSTADTVVNDGSYGNKFDSYCSTSCSD